MKKYVVITKTCSLIGITRHLTLEKAQEKMMQNVQHHIDEFTSLEHDALETGEGLGVAWFIGHTSAWYISPAKEDRTVLNIFEVDSNGYIIVEALSHFCGVCNYDSNVSIYAEYKDRDEAIKALKNRSEEAISELGCDSYEFWDDTARLEINDEEGLDWAIFKV